MTSAPSLSHAELLACAEAAAREAGRYALDNAHRRRETHRVTPHDVKLKLDIETQARAEAVIRDTFPDHTTLGEEDDHGAAEQAAPSWEAAAAPFCPRSMGRYVWIIDPIDGTLNFLHGMDQWCTSIAVMRDDAVLAGVVYAPALDLCYTATASSPARRNGAPIRVSATPRLDAAIVRTGMDQNLHLPIAPLTCVNAMSLKAQRARVMGAAALDLCAVADGQADGFFENSIYVWDAAAGGLVVRAAGGQAHLFGPRLGHQIGYLATNGAIETELADVLRPLLGGPTAAST